MHSAASKRLKETARKNFEERPPCKICGDNTSTGYHCGTVTCEACKKFFLRNAQGEHLKFTCQYSRDCIITSQSRTSCQYCRYQKCLSENMKLEEKNSSRDVEKEKIKVECKVCKGPSSGFHFGAHTCEGCKGFFRRMIKEIKDGRELACQALEKGKCQITSETRNNCKACRYQRCLEAKMDLHHCRIGRRSNLLKQNLKNRLSLNLVDKSDYNSFNQVINQIVMINSNSNNNLDIKNSSSSTDFDYEPLNQHHEMSALSEFERRLLKKACDAHDCYAQQLPAMKDSKTHLSDNKPVALGYLERYADACGYFARPFFDGYMDQRNFYRIISACVHSIRLISFAKQTAHDTNYFECSDELFSKIKSEFPIFKDICFTDILDILRSLKMDYKEFALYSALVMFASGCRCDPRYANFMATMNTQLCHTLMKYMQSRRKESESCETLINLLSKFAKLNCYLQERIYRRLKELNFSPVGSYYSDNIITNVFYLPCENRLSD